MRHIYLKCKNHPDLRWQAKSIAVNSDGSYNGMRNLFYNGRIDKTYPPECSCPPSELTFADETEQKTWAEDEKDN